MDAVDSFFEAGNALVSSSLLYLEAELGNG